MNPAFALAEVLWILNGHEDAAFLNYWNSRLPLFAGRGPTYTGAYGYRLRRRFGLDQVERAVNALSKNGATRQVVLQIWDPRRDLPKSDGDPASPDVPCNVTSLLKLRNGRLEWMQVLRSNDLFLGVPHNFVQFTMLQEVMAGWLGIEPGSYTQVADSLHAYVGDAKALREPARVPLPQSDTSIAFPRRISEKELGRLDTKARMMTRNDLRAKGLDKEVAGYKGPEEFRAWLCLLGAEAARRRRWDGLVAELEGEITSPVLSLLWSRWRKRVDESLRRRNELEAASEHAVL